MRDGLASYQLMERAAAAAFSVLKAQYPKARRLLVCAGMGHNGGDGFELARLAKASDFTVTVYTVGEPNTLKGSAARAAQACEAAGVPIHPFSSQSDLSADLLIDALLGIGLTGSVREPHQSAIEAINAASAPVLSIDVPSGLSADTGRVLGSAVKADTTISFIGLKKGLFTSQGPRFSGAVLCDALDLPELLFKQHPVKTHLLDWKMIRPLLPMRARDAHKGDCGHVLVVGGDYGMGGAVRMASEAALRAGSGWVSVATRPEHLSIVSGSRPELMCHAIETPQDLDPLLKRASVLVIGPGLGNSTWSKSLLTHLLASPLPKVLDADALNLLSQSPQTITNAILTPHPGEAGRLLNQPCQTIQDDRFAAIKDLQAKYSSVIVLKGVGSLIKGADEIIDLCPAGNPGMATGGMGDVLSGIIGALVAQKLSLLSATKAGVLIHALAADHAAIEDGERGLLASDLLSHIRHLVNPEQEGQYDH